MAKRKANETSDSTTPNFEEALARIAEIVEQLEDGELSLGDSLQAYVDGVKHLKLCHAALQETERKIELLAGFNSAGNAITQPFDDTASGGEAQVGKRSRETVKPAKSAGRNPDNTVDDSRELF